jgi:hypothetical protein
MNLRLVSFALALAGAAAGPVSAQTYVAAGAGGSWYGARCPAEYRCDETDVAGKLQLGHRYANGLGVDLSVFDHGTLRGENLSINGLPARYRMDGSGFGLRVAYFLPFERHWLASVHAGLARTRAKLSTATLDGSITGYEGESFRDTVGYYGLSVHYQFTPAFSLGLDADFTDYEVPGYKFDGSAYALTVRFAF